MTILSNLSVFLEASSNSAKTSAFKDWFSGSKIVDKKGNPRIVYHGTYADFTEFNTGRGDMIFFGDKSVAGQFGKKLMPVYLRATNPFSGDKNIADIKDDVIKKFKRIKTEINSAAKETGTDEITTSDNLISRIKGIDYFVVEESPTLREIIKSHGFDAIISDETAGESIGVFSSDQIRLAKS
jgi:hypothetical protein